MPNPEPKVRPSWGSRLLGIEGLRALAATTVLVGHVVGKMGPDVLNGLPDRIVGMSGHGLTLFFALSGFLLYRPFASSILQRRPMVAIEKYAFNRALRIFPVYVFILLVVGLVLGLANTQAPSVGDQDFSRTDRTVGYLTDPLDLLTSLFMIQTYFPETNRVGLGVAWSLSVELLFYILLPVLALMAVRLSRHLPAGVAILAPCATLLLLGLIGKTWSWLTLRGASPEDRFGMEWGNNWYAVANRSIFVHGDLFAYGMAAAVIVVAVQAGAFPTRLLQPVRLVAVAGGAVSLLIVFQGWGRAFNDCFAGAACGSLLLLVCLPNGRGEHARIDAMLEVAPIRRVGEISYSIYLWHVPVIWALSDRGWQFGETMPGLAANLALVLAVTLTLSELTYRYIESPPMRLKKRTGPVAADTAPNVVSTR